VVGVAVAVGVWVGVAVVVGVAVGVVVGVGGAVAVWVGVAVVVAVGVAMKHRDGFRKLQRNKKAKRKKAHKKAVENKPPKEEVIFDKMELPGAAIMTMADLDDAWAKMLKKHAEAEKMWAMGRNICDEANRIEREGDYIFCGAAIAVYGPKLSIKWSDDGCEVEGVIYRY
jgi:predicted metalloprotease